MTVPSTCSINHDSRLIENITLLWTVTEVPEQPKENRFQCEHDKTRQLTPEREKQLAESFAFISASTDDMLRVMAVCVEEDLDGVGMTIRLASNTGDLSRVVAGLTGIAGTLEKAALREESRADIKQKIFRQILLIDEARILSRLRSRHAQRSRKTAGKPGLLALLCRTVDDPSIHPRGKLAKATVFRVRAHSKRLFNAFNRFESAREDEIMSSIAQNILNEVLTLAYEFDIEGLQETLQMSASIDPTLKTFLPQAMRKLGHYCCIASDLTDAARSSRYTIFRRITIEALREPEVKSISFDKLVDFDKTLQRINRLPYHQKSESYLFRSLLAAHTRFQSRISSRATPRKIHAEIQLLFFYEGYPNIRHPRIICSSKSACYLCDLFIKTHGKFHIPRTHGRLYDRWILPERSYNGFALNASTLAVIERFNMALEAKILQAFHGSQTPFRHPNESILPFREPWSSVSTAYRANVSSSTAQLLEHVHGDILKHQENPQSQSSVIADASSPKGSLKSHLPTVQISRVERDLSEVQEITAEQQACMDPSISSTASLRLSRGDRMCYKLTHSSDTCIVQTDAINVHISYDFHTEGVTAHPSAKHKVCWVQVEWLVCDRQNSHDDGGNRSVELDKLEYDQELIIEDGAAFSPKQLSLRKGDHTVLVKHRFDDPNF